MRWRLLLATSDAGWSSSVARRAHNPKVVGSNPAPATNSFVSLRCVNHRRQTNATDFCSVWGDNSDAGWSSSVARRAHNPKVVGSNPAPATNFFVSLRCVNHRRQTNATDSCSVWGDNSDAGWSSSVARRAHNPKVVGSNPAPATNFFVSLRCVNHRRRTNATDICSVWGDNSDAGWSSSVARRAHNPKVVGSNPAPATNFFVNLRWCEPSKADKRHRLLLGLG